MSQSLPNLAIPVRIRDCGLRKLFLAPSAQIAGIKMRRKADKPGGAGVDLNEATPGTPLGPTPVLGFPVRVNLVELKKNN